MPPQNKLSKSFTGAWYQVSTVGKTSGQWRSQPKNLGGAKKLGGQMLDFRQITLYFWKNASQSTK